MSKLFEIVGNVDHGHGQNSARVLSALRRPPIFSLQRISAYLPNVGRTAAGGNPETLTPRADSAKIPIRAFEGGEMESYIDEYRRLTKMLGEPKGRFGWVIGRRIYRTDDRRRLQAEERLARLKRYFDDHGITPPS